jgi:hypothetical protein
MNYRILKKEVKKITAEEGFEITLDIKAEDLPDIVPDLRWPEDVHPRLKIIKKSLGLRKSGHIDNAIYFHREYQCYIEAEYQIDILSFPEEEEGRWRNWKIRETERGTVLNEGKWSVEIPLKLKEIGTKAELEWLKNNSIWLSDNDGDSAMSNSHSKYRWGERIRFLEQKLDIAPTERWTDDREYIEIELEVYKINYVPQNKWRIENAKIAFWIYDRWEQTEIPARIPGGKVLKTLVTPKQLNRSPEWSTFTEIDRILEEDEVREKHRYRGKEIEVRYGIWRLLS